MNCRERTRATFWGLVLLITSFAIPLPIRSVPKVTLESDNLQGDTIFCEGCNPLVFGQPLNVNVALIQQLMSLPNILEKKEQQRYLGAPEVEIRRVQDFRRFR